MKTEPDRFAVQGESGIDIYSFYIDERNNVLYASQSINFSPEIIRESNNLLDDYRNSEDFEQDKIYYYIDINRRLPESRYVFDIFSSPNKISLGNLDLISYYRILENRGCVVRNKDFVKKYLISKLNKKKDSQDILDIINYYLYLYMNASIMNIPAYRLPEIHDTILRDEGLIVFIDQEDFREETDEIIDKIKEETNILYPKIVKFILNMDRVY